MILATRFTFIVERSWKNMYFHPKLAWPPATYDVISRNHSSWPSLNSSQNLREGWTNSYWKRQVLMFYPPGKNSEKPYWGGGGGGGTGYYPLSPLVRPRVKLRGHLKTCLRIIWMPKSNSPALLFEPLYRHQNCFSSSVAADAKAGYVGFKHYISNRAVCVW